MDYMWDILHYYREIVLLLVVVLQCDVDFSLEFTVKSEENNRQDYHDRVQIVSYT